MIPQTRKLFLLSQEAYSGYDTYDSAVICAHDAEEAIRLSIEELGGSSGGWADAKDRDKIKSTYLGNAVPAIKLGLVLGSYNAG